MTIFDKLVFTSAVITAFLMWYCSFNIDENGQPPKILKWATFTGFMVIFVWVAWTVWFRA